MAKKTPKAAPFVAEPGATEALQSALYNIHSDIVNYNDSSPVTIFTVPAGFFVFDISCEILTVFAGTSPVLSVGVAGSTARHLATTDITTTTLGTYGAAKVSPWRYAADTDIICTIGGSALTQGQARFYMTYRPIHNNKMAFPI